jgi:hypothetical protein
MSRQVVSLSEPPNEPIELQSGPLFALANLQFVRCGSAQYKLPWFFCCDHGGRFDIWEIAHHGTCYIASDLPGAIRDRIGPEYKQGGSMVATYFDKWVYWTISTPANPPESTIADLVNDRWNGRGITEEIFTTTDYPLCQRWATRFYQGGHGGLRVRLRHVLGLQRYGLALFGEVGSVPKTTQFVASSPIRITRTDLDLFEEEMNIKVLSGLPTLAELLMLS